MPYQDRIQGISMPREGWIGANLACSVSSTLRPQALPLACGKGDRGAVLTFDDAELQIFEKILNFLSLSYLRATSGRGRESPR